MVLSWLTHASLAKCFPLQRNDSLPWNILCVIRELCENTSSVLSRNHKSQSSILKKLGKEWKRKPENINRPPYKAVVPLYIE